jgi:transcriptional regulator with XRE-family HTH domain
MHNRSSQEAEAIKLFQQAHKLTQAELAQRAGVSQSAVSRILSGRAAQREGRARRRLLELVGEGAGVRPALTAVSEIWDGSDAHAQALAALIRASAELWPQLGAGHG